MAGKWEVEEKFIVRQRPRRNAVLEKKKNDGQNVIWNTVQTYSHRYRPLSSIKKIHTFFSVN
jgi:hypothetical protein